MHVACAPTRTNGRRALLPLAEQRFPAHAIDVLRPLHRINIKDAGFCGATRLKMQANAEAHMDIIDVARQAGMTVVLEARIGRQEYHSVHGSLAALLDFAERVRAMKEEGVAVEQH
jgi:hypothetical protein